MTLQDAELLEALHQTVPGKLPTELIRDLQARGSAVVPGLIAILQEGIRRARDGEESESNAEFFAFLLLGAIGDPSALPVITEAISLPEEPIQILLGDLIHDNLPPIMVRLSNGDVESIAKLIRNRALYPYVRWSLTRCYLYMVREGTLSREEAARRLEEHLTEEMPLECYELNAGLCIELGNLAIPSSLDVVRRAYETGCVEEYIVDFDSLAKDFESGDSQFKSELHKLRPLEIDVVEELSGWASFRDRSAKPVEPSARVTRPDPRKLAAHSQPRPQATTDSDKPQPRPRRNDPCSCGSGKKYKKCCGAKR